MAHFAKIGLNGRVIFVTHLPDEEILDDAGIEQEQIGVDLLEQRHGWPIWVQCSINTSAGKHYTYDTETGLRTISDTQEKAFRGNFPGVGDVWDEANGYFYDPRTKEFNSFVWDSDNIRFKAPIDEPTRDTYINNSPNKNLDVSWSENNSTFKGVALDDQDEIYLWNADTNSWNIVSQ